MITIGKAVQPAQHHCNDCHNTSDATASISCVGHSCQCLWREQWTVC